MDSITEKFSVFDYFNLLIGGMVFLFGLGLCGYPETKSILLNISNMISGSTFLLIIAMILFVCLSFVVGTVINEIGNWIFKGWLKWEQNLVKKCLISENVVGNNSKLKSYRKKAFKFLSSQVPDFDKEYKGEVYTEDHCAYFFAYCSYYIQIHKLDKKAERLREVQGLSMLLACAFALVPFANLIFSKMLGKFNIYYGINPIVICVCFFFAGVFARKHYCDIMNRVRMVLAVYDACIATENAEHLTTQTVKGD